MLDDQSAAAKLGGETVSDVIVCCEEQVLTISFCMKVFVELLLNFRFGARLLRPHVG